MITVRCAPALRHIFPDVALKVRRVLNMVPLFPFSPILDMDIHTYRML